jgi:hypothetical protein
MRLTKDVAKLVARERVCRVATAGRDGVPHVVPVCHVLVDGKLCFGSDDDARKVKNVRANPRVAVTVDVYSDDWSILRGVLLQGPRRSSRMVRGSGSSGSCSTRSTRSIRRSRRSRTASS